MITSGGVVADFKIPVPSFTKRALLACALAVSLSAAAVAAQAAVWTPNDAQRRAAINRLTWGIDTVAVAASSGANVGGSFTPDRWLDMQLAVSSQQLDAARAVSDGLRNPGMLDNLDKLKKLPRDLILERAAIMAPAPDLAAANTLANQYNTAVLNQVRQRQVLRQIYSERQVQEQMTWFWTNHFYANGTLTVGYYENDVVRPRALGKFKDLLTAIMKSSSVLSGYANNTNSAPNVGGGMLQFMILNQTIGNSEYRNGDLVFQAGPSSANIASESIVLGQILSGVRVLTQAEIVSGAKADMPLLDPKDIVYFEAAKHHSGEKVLLGKVVADMGVFEIDQAAAIIAAHPDTARNICWQLIKFFATDRAPPAALHNAMIATYNNTGGDIGAVLKTMITSSWYLANVNADRSANSIWKPLLKDNHHYVISAMRLLYGGGSASLNYPEVNGVGPAQAIANAIASAGQPIYGRTIALGGYPIEREFADTEDMLIKRINFAKSVANVPVNLFGCSNGCSNNLSTPNLLSAYRSYIVPTLLNPSQPDWQFISVPYSVVSGAPNYVSTNGGSQLDAYNRLDMDAGAVNGGAQDSAAVRTKRKAWLTDLLTQPALMAR